MSKSITPAAARAELERRRQKHLGNYYPPANDQVFRMGNAALQAIAGPAAAQAPTRNAKAIRAQVTPPAKAARPTGPGSRGGDPVKALRAKVASTIVTDKAADMAGWWNAYRATKGMTEVELSEALKALQLTNA